MHSSVITASTLLLGNAFARSLGQVLINHGSLSMLHNLLRDLDLLQRFEAAKRSTLLAMTDDALVGLANWGLNMSTIDPPLARAILEYHFLEGVYTSTDPSLPTEIQLVHSILRPPILTNVTRGPVVKLSKCQDETFYAESGIQKVLKISDSDIFHDNGVVHTIDSNLVLPHNISETTNLGNFHEFWRFVEKSGTQELLESMRDVTIFLPDDNAVKQGRPLLDSLRTGELAAIVANHAIPNHVLYHNAITEEVRIIQTLGGLKITVKRGSNGDILVNDAKVLTEDVLIFGGVAHIISGILAPDTVGSDRFSFINMIWSQSSSWWTHSTSLTAQYGIAVVAFASLAILGIFKGFNRILEEKRFETFSVGRYDKRLQAYK